MTHLSPSPVPHTHPPSRQSGSPVPG